MDKLRRAYSLAELILVVLFMGILAAVAVPRINFAIISKQKVDTTVEKLMTDLRRTRRLAISDAAVNTTGYGIQLTGAGPYTGYEIWDRSTFTLVDSHPIDSDVTCTADSRFFRFGPMGNTVASGSTIKLSAKGRSFTITVVPATGMVKCVEN